MNNEGVSEAITFTIGYIKGSLSSQSVSVCILALGGKRSASL